MGGQSGCDLWMTKNGIDRKAEMAMGLWFDLREAKIPRRAFVLGLDDGYL